MPQIRDPRHQRLLAREFDIREGFISTEVERTVQPVVVLADLEGRDVFGDAPFFRRFAKGASGTGDATHPAQIWMVNPAGSNSLVIIRRAIVGQINGVVNRLDLGFVSAPPAPVSTFRGAPLNQRTNFQSVATLNASGVAASSAFDAPGTLMFVRAAGITYTLDKLDIVLAPGGPAFICSSTENNTSVDMSLMWDEIAIEP